VRSVQSSQTEFNKGHLGHVKRPPTACHCGRRIANLSASVHQDAIRIKVKPPSCKSTQEELANIELRF
jgi:hypothetical protein